MRPPFSEDFLFSDAGSQVTRAGYQIPSSLLLVIYFLLSYGSVFHYLYVHSLYFKG